MFVAVRAIAPVAGMPPKIGAMFATPYATSSMFDLWRVPIMPSATTAERRDSMAASSAIVIDGGISSRMLFHGVGRCGAGSDDGTPAKREPMVSTGSAKSSDAFIEMKTASATT